MRLLAPVALLALLAACAVPLPIPPVAQQQAPGPVQPPPERPHLWYVGLGLQGETWSENDVADTATRLRQVATAFQVEPVVLSNRIAATPEHYPAVDGRSVEQAMAAIAQRTQPGDLVLVYVSTHGAPGLLGRAAGGRELAPVGTEQLRRWLSPLGDRDTVLILSACFSGSFIPPLRNDHRVIFTAARADRTSFGCQPGAEHTVFGDALLDSLSPDESLHALVDRTREAVAEREHDMGVRAPSFPQVSVGAAVQHLYDAPVF